MAKKEKVTVNTEVTDDLSTIIADSLNTKFKNDLGQVAYFLGEEDDPSNINEWIPTGSTELDLAISNRPDGGVPVGRLSEFAGLESSGKTLIASHILANTQKKGGLAVFIETENSLDDTFLKAVGVDTKTMLHIPMDAIEDVMATIESIAIKVREKDKSKLVTIVVDSIAAATTKTELEADYDKAGYNTTKAIVLSQGLRKLMPIIAKQRICLVFVNQLRSKVGMLVGADPWTTPGGKAVPFHASVRVRLKPVAKIKGDVNEVEQIIGIRTRAEVVKNKLGPAYRVAEFTIFYDRGIDDYGSWLETCKKFGLVSTAGAWYSYTNTETGEVVKFQSKDWYEKMIHNDELRTQVYAAICNKLIMKYASTTEIGIDDVKLDATDIPTE